MTGNGLYFFHKNGDFDGGWCVQMALFYPSESHEIIPILAFSAVRGSLGLLLQGHLRHQQRRAGPGNAANAARRRGDAGSRTGGPATGLSFQNHQDFHG